MIRKTYFVLEQSPFAEGQYTITINFELLPPMTTTGSYNILFARLMGLSYPQYLRFCRDVLKAEVIGKNTFYPIVYFKKNLETTAFVRLLNTQMNFVMWEREHPDWREHQEYLKMKQEEKVNVPN